MVRQRACFFDNGHLAASQDNLDQGGMVARLEPDGWIRFRHLRYQDFSLIQLHGWVHGGDATLSIHKDSPDSPPLVSTTVKSGPATGKASVWTLAMPNANVHGAPADVIIAPKAPSPTSCSSSSPADRPHPRHLPHGGISSGGPYIGSSQMLPDPGGHSQSSWKNNFHSLCCIRPCSPSGRLNAVGQHLKYV